MPQATLTDVLRHLRRIWEAQEARGQPDGDLLERFLTHNDQAAFSALVHRHGPVVLGVARRVLGDLHAAEDVFQATFLVLVRRAGSIWKHKPLAGWLYGVAQRIALRARAKAAAQRNLERRSEPMPQSEPLDDLTWQELRGVIDKEIAALPEKYRLPVVLCHLQGLSYDQAAKELGWQKSSLAKRLTKARELLRRRLIRRGVTLSAAALATALESKVAAAPIGALLAINTVKAALSYAAGKAAAGGCVSTAAIVMAEQAMRTMLGTGAKLAILFMSLSTFVAGAGVAGYGAWVQDWPGENKHASKPPTAKVQVATTPPQKADAAVDLYGDPLPPEALARLGTVRFRNQADTWGVRFSPDGQTLVGTTLNGVIIWDAATGKERHRLPINAGTPGNPRDFDIAPDGTSVILADLTDLFASPMIGFWDLQSGKKVRTLALPEPKEGIDQLVAQRFGAPLCFSSDGKSLAVCYAQRFLIFDLATGQVRKTFGKTRNAVSSVAFAPDGKTLAIGTSDPGLQVWDIATGQMVHAIQMDPANKEAYKTWVHAVAFSRDGKTLAAGCWDLIVLVDPISGKELGRLQAPMGPVNGVAFTPDGDALVSGSDDGKARVWDVASGKLRSTIDSRMTCRSMALSLDGKTVAMGSRSAVKLCDIATARDLFADYQGHSSSVLQLAFSPDGKSLYSSELYSQIRAWDTASWKTKKFLPERATALSIAPDGKRLAWASANDKVRVWDLANDKEDLTITVPDTKDVRWVRFSPNSQKLFTWDKMPSKPVNDEIKPDGKVANWSTNRLRHWNAITGKLEKLWTFPHLIDPPLVAPDGMGVLIDSQKDTIQFHDFNTGRMRLFGGTKKGWIRPLAVSWDSRLLASGDHAQDYAVRLWEIVTGKEVFSLKGHDGSVIVAAWSADARFLASADNNDNRYRSNPQKKMVNTIRLWDTVAGKELACFSGLNAVVASLAISPDGFFLAAGLHDSTILIWDIRQSVRAAKVTVKRLEAADLEINWAILGGDNVRQAHDAAWTLIAAPDQSVPFLRDRLKPVATADNVKIQKWITELASDTFAVRQAAAKELEKVGEQVRAPIQKALKGDLSLETRRRLEAVLDALADVPGPEALRALRGIMVLEKIGSPEARSVLETLAGGAPGATETEAAKAALARRGDHVP
jgi:RNA polymerase sigma factor (sigma-70 family)